MVLYGQIIVGPPGAGKTTYCQGMSLFLASLGRKCLLINLDFANDHIPYEAAIDVRDLITIESVMQQHDLGPNGGLVFCMEYLLSNIDWLMDRITGLDAHYVIIDCPGQVELFSHHRCVEMILSELKPLDVRLCSVHLVDSYYCCQPSTFVSAVLLVAATMLRMGLPHVNVLSKVDLLPSYGPLPFQLDFFTDLVDLVPLARYVDNSFSNDENYLNSYESDDDGDEVADRENATKTLELVDTTLGRKMAKRSKNKRRFHKMTEALCDMLTDFGLVSFLPMNIQDGETVGRVLAAVDRANGYSFAATYATADPKRGKQQSPRGQNDKDIPTSSTIDYTSHPTPSLNELYQLAARDTELSYFRSLDIMERYSVGYEVSSKVEEIGAQAIGYTKSSSDLHSIS